MLKDAVSQFETLSTHKQSCPAGAKPFQRWAFAVWRQIQCPGWRILQLPDPQCFLKESSHPRKQNYWNKQCKENVSCSRKQEPVPLSSICCLSCSSRGRIVSTKQLFELLMPFMKAFEVCPMEVGQNSTQSSTAPTCLILVLRRQDDISI